MRKNPIRISDVQTLHDKFKDDIRTLLAYAVNNLADLVEQMNDLQSQMYDIKKNLKK